MNTKIKYYPCASEAYSSAVTQMVSKFQILGRATELEYPVYEFKWVYQITPEEKSEGWKIFHDIKPGE